jgi:hypothetical protein
VAGREQEVAMNTDEPLPDSRLERDESADSRHALISSRRIEGARVFNREDGKLGTIHSVMIDKVTGRVPYALLSFGGFLGINGRVHPVPWERLHYDTGFDAYLLDTPYEALKRAPTLRLDEAERPQPAARRREMIDHYTPRV